MSYDDATEEYLREQREAKAIAAEKARKNRASEIKRNSPLVAARKARSQQTSKHQAQSAFLVFQLRDEASYKTYSPRLRALLAAAAAEIERLQQLPLM